MNKEIIINKEGDGDVFELLQESSEGSSIECNPKVYPFPESSIFIRTSKKCVTNINESKEIPK